MSLDIMNGQKIALIGASGNGKSTLLSLIRGLYETDNVSLHIDQKEYRSLSILHHITSLIPQDPEIFEHSIRYNITMGIDVSDEEIQPYIEIADFDTVIKDLPHGLDSDIKEK
ncbi:ATP-binding cassette domain-containing protein [Patescibacteria group bacterium]|nr:ATP-binding cassette domain-containing protein [Patescibacteria group bacterium]